MKIKSTCPYCGETNDTPIFSDEVADTGSIIVRCYADPTGCNGRYLVDWEQVMLIKTIKLDSAQWWKNIADWGSQQNG